MLAVGYNDKRMKKYFFASLILLAACSVFDDPATHIPTAMPGAINIIVAQTAAAASTQTALSIPPTPTSSLTPFPSQTPPITSTATPTFVFLLSTPTDAPLCPFTAPYYVRVRPFTVGSHNWNVYIPNFPAGDPYGYPATLFLQYVLNSSSWTMDTEYIELTGAWMSALANLNGPGWNYLHNASEGTFFNGNKLGVDTFPGNVLLVTGRRYRRGECWDSISAFAYSDLYSEAALDLPHLPAYQLGLQTGMNYSTPGVVYPAPSTNGNIYVPILSQHANLWIEDNEVEAFPSLPMDVTVMANTLDLKSSTDPKSSRVVETMLSGARLELTDYFPTQRNTFGQVTDPKTGKTGYIPLFNWTAYMKGSYTTTWTMKTLPVPPG
jgi:hypothetical protein